jgi:hypothetical protein
MKIDDLTLGEIKEITKLIGSGGDLETPFEIGKSYFLRTVTYHIVGKVKKIVGKFLFLESASWVADSGRFMNAIKNGTLNEVEPIGEWFVNFESITDFGEWKNELPTTQK